MSVLIYPVVIRHDSSTIEELGVPSKLDEINSCISAFESGKCDIAQLKRIAMLCRRNPVAEPPLSPFEFASPTSPSPFLTPANSVPSLQIEIWDKDKNFERLFNALMAFMSSDKVASVFFNNVASLTICRFIRATRK